MSHVIELSDEQYAAIEQGAKEQGISPQAYVQMLAESLRQAQASRPVYDDLDSMFKALGMTDEQIAESDQMADTWFPPDSDDHADAGSTKDAAPSLVEERLRKRRTERHEIAIFTPGNEPYLGRESLYHFDQVLLEFIAQQRRISQWTSSASLTPIQRAASELVPSASSIALSIRELVRQAYLLSALILTRPLMERVATLSYLLENPSAITLWEQGWPHKTRPNIRKRLNAMRGSGRLDESHMGTILDRYNGLVHGDPAAALHGAILLHSGGAGYTIGKDLGSPRRADDICFETTMWLLVLLAHCTLLFPEVG